MNSVLFLIIIVPIIEIYLFIKIGSQIGAFNTVLLIFLTAFVGLIYVKYENQLNIKLICFDAFLGLVYDATNKENRFFFYEFRTQDFK